MRAFAAGLCLFFAACDEKTIDYEHPNLVLGGRMGFGRVEFFARGDHVAGYSPGGPKSVYWNHDGTYLCGDAGSPDVSMLYEHSTGRLHGWMPWLNNRRWRGRETLFLVTETESGRTRLVGRAPESIADIQLGPESRTISGRWRSVVTKEQESLRLGPRSYGQGSPLRSPEVLAAILAVLSERTAP